MALCVLESLAPQGTPGQRSCDSVRRTTVNSRSSSRPARSNAGKRIADHVPALAAAYPSMVFDETNQVLTSDVDVVFFALPHGQSQRLVPQLLERHVRVVDLGADFRLKDDAQYATWYGSTHVAPGVLANAVYGLVERHRKELVGATLIAVPGCYPTASILALGPFLDAQVIERRGIVVNALSGTSGAGRATSDRLHFSRLAGNAEAYGLLSHRHTPEIQQELDAELLFTPHLVSTSRGMLVTAYGRVADATLDHRLGAVTSSRRLTPTIPSSWSPTSHRH
jgi:N-acetyl-gamma-glutamyl-phosphate reductase